MKSLMYRSPRLYLLMLKTMHGNELERRYQEIARIAGGRKVFEAGCGPALLGRYLEKDRYCGMDLNERFVRYARKKGYRCVVGDIMSDGFPKAEVGVIVDVLHHITPQEKRLIERMREKFETVVVIEPVSAFNVRMPGILRKIWDSLLGDADGINPLENRKRWIFTRKELMKYLKDVGADRVYTLGRDVVAVFRRSEDRDKSMMPLKESGSEFRG